MHITVDICDNRGPYRMTKWTISKLSEDTIRNNFPFEEKLNENN